MCLLGKETTYILPVRAGVVLLGTLPSVFVALFGFSLWVCVSYFFFSLEDGPVLFVLFLCSSSCHLGVMSSSGKGTTLVIPRASSLWPPLPNNADAHAPVPTRRDCLPSAQQLGRTCQAGRCVGMNLEGRGGSSGNRFHDGAPSHDSESNAKSEENSSAEEQPDPD